MLMVKLPKRTIDTPYELVCVPRPAITSVSISSVYAPEVTSSRGHFFFTSSSAMRSRVTLSTWLLNQPMNSSLSALRRPTIPTSSCSGLVTCMEKSPYTMVPMARPVSGSRVSPMGPPNFTCGNSRVVTK